LSELFRDSGQMTSTPSLQLPTTGAAHRTANRKNDLTLKVHLRNPGDKIATTKSSKAMPAGTEGGVLGPAKREKGWNQWSG
jgi:hypothetical protein